MTSRMCERYGRKKSLAERQKDNKKHSNVRPIMLTYCGREDFIGRLRSSRITRRHGNDNCTGCSSKTSSADSAEKEGFGLSESRRRLIF